MNMRVAHILRKYNLEEWGGTETYIEQLLEALKSKKVNSVVFCPKTEEKSAINDPLVERGYVVRKYHAYLPIVGISDKKKKKLLSLRGNLWSFDLIWLLWKEKEVNLIHSHTLGRLGAIGAFIARMKKIPFVISIHGTLLDGGEVNKPSSRKIGGWDWGKIFGFLLHSRKLIESADAIIVLNDLEKKFIQEKYPDKKVILIRSAISTEKFATNYTENACFAFPEIVEKDVLLILGRIDPVKNQIWIIQQAQKIIEKNPKTLIVFVGGCTDLPYYELLKNEIKNRKLEKFIFFMGELPFQDPLLIGLIQKSVAVIIPSRFESFGLVILEAWASRSLIISSNTSGAVQKIIDGENGFLFDLESPESFHNALCLAFDHPDSIDQIKERGRKLVTEKYSLDSFGERMKQLYEELIREKAK